MPEVKKCFRNETSKRAICSDAVAILVDCRRLSRKRLPRIRLAGRPHLLLTCLERKKP
jgi:hypothetical protein